MATQTMGMTMTMTATRIDATILDSKDFEIPSDYEIKPFDASMFGGMNGE